MRDEKIYYNPELDQLFISYDFNRPINIFMYEDIEGELKLKTVFEDEFINYIEICEL